MILDILFLPGIFIIGFITCYQDFKEGKIKNKWIKLGIVWAIFAVLILFLGSADIPFIKYFSGGYSIIMPQGYFLKFFLNVLFSLVAMYALWYFDLWSAGDAKLFFVFTLLLPLKYYGNSFLPFFPSFVLLLNIFLLAALFLLMQNFYFLIKTSVKNGLDFNKDKIKLKFLSLIDSKRFQKKRLIRFGKILVGSLSFLFIFQIINLTLQQLFGKGNGSNSLWLGLFFVALFFVKKPLEKLFEKNAVIIGAVFLIAFYFAFNGDQFSKMSGLFRLSLIWIFMFAGIAYVFSFVYDKDRQHMFFAVWIFLGTVFTIMAKGSLIQVASSFWKNFY